MQHELQIMNTPSADVWTDFGYSSEHMRSLSAKLATSMIQHMMRSDVETKTQAFRRALEDEGEEIGLKLDTPTDYFILGAAFAAMMQAMAQARRHISHTWLKLPLTIAAGLSAGFALAQFLQGEREWIGYASMAVLLYVLKNQLTRVYLD